MSKTVNNSTASSITTTDYLTGFQYTGGTMAFFPHAEGYVNVRTGPAYNYVFNYTDHLGNVRVSYAKDAVTNTLRILEENHYYAFGLKHSNYNTDIFVIAEQGTIKQLTNPLIGIGYKYKYNGKELQDELGLNFYDYGARNYDAALGRWMNIDPLAEKFPNMSPYAYCANNPIIYIDPDGRELILAGDKKNIDRTITVANQGIGSNIVKVDKNGNVTMKSLNNKQLSKLTSEQKAMYGVMKDAISAEGKVKIGVESGSKDVLIGSYALEKIDIADIEAFGTGKAVNQSSTLGHEIKEQQEKQLNGEAYGDAHADGMAAENAITGYERKPRMAPTTKMNENSDGTISGNADVIYTKGTSRVKASIEIENNNVKKVTRTDE